MTVGDIIRLPEFMEKLKYVIDGEVSNQRKAMTEAVTRGMRLQRTPLDSLRERCVLEAEKIAELWEAIICKRLIGFSAGERNYIDLLGLTAYKRTVIKLREDEKKKE